MHKEEVVVVVGDIVGGCRTVQRTRSCPGCAAAAVGRRTRTSDFEIVIAEFQRCRTGSQKIQTYPPSNLFGSAGGVALVQELVQVVVLVELPPLLPLPLPVLDGGERCGGCGRSCWRRIFYPPPALGYLPSPRKDPDGESSDVSGDPTSLSHESPARLSGESEKNEYGNPSDDGSRHSYCERRPHGKKTEDPAVKDGGVERWPTKSREESKAFEFVGFEFSYN
ncbi:hypothetical protein M5K25_003874 [Dendrobium thyrsiflorum]|uniref:Uncharacterized protein n=1 Tax=Dendrobium thyrsiflorum TaxID=117978 RepID=A0ABD0VKP0_DENTH